MPKSVPKGCSFDDIFWKKGPGVPLLGIFLGIFLRCISDEILFGDSKGNSCEHGIYMYIEINNI